MSRALALFSGGMDSFISIKLIQEQGIDVTAVYFSSPFMTSNVSSIKEKAKIGGFELKEIKIEGDYLQILKNPSHGYGKNANPCIDCHAYMLRKVKEVMEKEGYDFVITGEVLGQRPKSQRRNELNIVEKESGLSGKLLRPMSAKLLEETEVEKKGIVDRNKLLDINGRTRKKQIEMMKKYGLEKWTGSGGGCLLTDPGYGRKVKDLVTNEMLSMKELEIIKHGRYFRKAKNIIIVGRKQENNEALMKLKEKEDLMFEVANDIPGPVTLLKGPVSEEMIQLAASLTARYSDAESDEVEVKYGKEKLDNNISVEKIKEKDLDKIKF